MRLEPVGTEAFEILYLRILMIPHLNEGCVDAYTMFLSLRGRLYHLLLMDGWKALRRKGYKSLNVHAGRQVQRGEER